MRLVQRIAGVALTLALAALVGAAAWWLVTSKSDTPKGDKPPGPAAVEKVVKETDLTTVTLTEKAEERIGLTVAAVEKKDVRRVRVYGGEVTVPVGRAILVAAPFGGVLEAPPGGMPEAGKAVKRGDTVVLLSPLLSPEAKITMSANLAQAEGQLKTTAERVHTAEQALARAKKAFDTSGSKAQLELAQGNFAEAQESHEAAKLNRDVLTKALGELDKGTTTPIPIPAPESGILRTVSARPGQKVPNGAALFEVADLSTLWVRVPLPVGDLESVDRAAVAQVGRLSAGAEKAPATAKPIPAPPSANPLAGTVDAFYEVPNADRKLSPGQRLGVTIPRGDPEASRTVPWSAVVVDVHGGTWVYERVAPRTYARRRAVVAYTVGADAVLKDESPKELAAGAMVVTKGVEELWGAETGFIKY